MSFVQFCKSFLPSRRFSPPLFNTRNFLVSRQNSWATDAKLLNLQPQSLIMWSPVEEAFLEKSKLPYTFHNETIKAIQVSNVYELGKLVSLRFLEWVIDNPTGVVALPTGRTPEFFIKTLEQYKLHWSEKSTQEEIRQFGLKHFETFPDTSELHFVMLDEFFPMAAEHRNSFCRYIRTYYLPLLGISNEQVSTFDLVEEGVLTMDELKLLDAPDVDIELLDREVVDDEEETKKIVLDKVKGYCDDYERRIRDMGGIGFFLGGIGPDGHIAFNQHGSQLDSTTRLVKFNYPSAAVAAGDLGGIEHSRGKAAVTIGLQTITARAGATVIIMAAGEGKAKVVRHALEESHPFNPATALQACEGSRFYITSGAASLLTARRTRTLHSASSSDCVTWALRHLSGAATPGGGDGLHSALCIPPAEYTAVEEYLYQCSMNLNTPVHLLNAEVLSFAGKQESSADGDENFLRIQKCPHFLMEKETCQVLVACAARRLREKVSAGLISLSPQGKSILHTAPHHDDIMLSYHAAMHQLLGRGSENTLAPSSTPPDNSYPSLSGAVSSQEYSQQQHEELQCYDSGHRYARHRSRSLPELSCGDCYGPLGEQCGGNVNHFAYLTSGFHSVNESFLQLHCTQLLAPSARNPDQSVLECIVLDGQMTRHYDDLLAEFRSLFFARKTEEERLIEHIIFLRCVCTVWDIVTTLPYRSLQVALTARVEWLATEYLAHHQPGDTLPKEIQLFKGCMRESEVDRVWALSRMPTSRIHHLRSKFYTDDFFTPMPSLVDDALPLANLIRSRQPDVLTVAFDPEGTGPDTHYKVLVLVAAALRLAMERGDLRKQPNPLVWGYRNVWFEFTPGDATLMLPVLETDLELMHNTFLSCFTTQKEASFPSPYYDGPFSAWARDIQCKQRRALGVMLGEEFFQSHEDARVRESEGFVFVKAMYASDFLKEVEVLKSRLER